LRNTVKTDFLSVTEKLKLSQSEIGDIRAEAIKEFAERLKYKTCCIPQCHFTYAEVEFKIDNLVKEMTEDKQ
jgi:hypothetical protein